MNRLIFFTLACIISFLSLTAFAQEDSRQTRKMPQPGDADKNGVLVLADEQPTFPGGFSVFYKYISEKMKYPKEAKKKGIQGKVFIKFMVGKDGSISNVKLLKGIGAGCDQEALNTIKNSPKWIAGRYRGNAVKVWMTIPIVFSLPKANKKTKGIWTD